MSARERLMNAVRCRCDSHGSWTVRVTGGSLDAAHWSVYGCDECAPLRTEIIRREFPDVEVVPLPGSTSQLPLFALGGVS